jgi:hypothetical protein
MAGFPVAGMLPDLLANATRFGTGRSASAPRMPPPPPSFAEDYYLDDGLHHSSFDPSLEPDTPTLTSAPSSNAALYDHTKSPHQDHPDTVAPGVPLSARSDPDTTQLYSRQDPYLSAQHAYQLGLGTSSVPQGVYARPFVPGNFYNGQALGDGAGPNPALHGNTRHGHAVYSMLGDVSAVGQGRRPYSEQQQQQQQQQHSQHEQQPVHGNPLWLTRDVGSVRASDDVARGVGSAGMTSAEEGLGDDLHADNFDTSTVASLLNDSAQDFTGEGGLFLTKEDAPRRSSSGAPSRPLSAPLVNVGVAASDSALGQSLESTPGGGSGEAAPSGKGERRIVSDSGATGRRLPVFNTMGRSTEEA